MDPHVVVLYEPFAVLRRVLADRLRRLPGVVVRAPERRSHLAGAIRDAALIVIDGDGPDLPELLAGLDGTAPVLVASSGPRSVVLALSRTAGVVAAVAKEDVVAHVRHALAGAGDGEGVRAGPSPDPGSPDGGGDGRDPIRGPWRPPT